VTVLADDDVVVHGNAERGGDLDDRFGHMDMACEGVGSPEGWLGTSKLKGNSYSRTTSCINVENDWGMGQRQISHAKS
jgi:hypothetical protein